MLRISNRLDSRFIYGLRRYREWKNPKFILRWLFRSHKWYKEVNAVFYIEERNNKMIGFCRIDSDGQLHYGVRKRFYNTGTATKMIGQVIKLHKKSKLYCIIDKSNIASITVATKFNLPIIPRIQPINMNITASIENIWESFDPRIRRAIRRNEKNGSIFCYGEINIFYNYYKKRMKAKSARYKNRRTFKEIVLVSDGTLLIEKQGSKIIGGGLFVFNDKQIRYILGFSLSQWLLWEVIKRGKRCYSSCFLALGRSQYKSGTYIFKTRFTGDNRI